MRIISGALRGRRLLPVPGNRIRPSSDMLREAVFNVLGTEVFEATVLDLYSGTGSLGIEALSRGASLAVFVDNHPQSIKILSRNLEACGLDARSVVYKRNILQGLGFLKKTCDGFNLIFMDPPYEKGLVEATLRLLKEKNLISENSCVVVEHSVREKSPEKGFSLIRTDQRRYGKALVSFYKYML